MSKFIVLATLLAAIFTFSACAEDNGTPGATSPATPVTTPTLTPTLIPTSMPSPTVTPVPTDIPLPNTGLDDFVFESSELPEACSVKKSPSLSSDRELTDQLIASALANDTLAASAVSSLYAVYYEGPEYNEIGYFGLEFESTTLAEQAAAILIQHGQGRTPGRSVFLVGNIVVEVWRDDEGTGNCFFSLKELVSVQTEQGGGLEMPTK